MLYYSAYLLIYSTETKSLITVGCLLTKSYEIFEKSDNNNKKDKIEQRS